MHPHTNTQTNSTNSQFAARGGLFFFYSVLPEAMRYIYIWHVCVAHWLYTQVQVPI
jgi:hypothetical protein